MTDVQKAESHPSAERVAARPIKHRRDFIRWLESLPPSHRFTRQSTNCALAQFCGAPVGWCTYESPPGMDHFLPDWAEEFVQRFCTTKGRLTARVALKVMEELP